MCSCVPDNVLVHQGFIHNRHKNHANRHANRFGSQWRKNDIHSSGARFFCRLDECLRYADKVVSGAGIVWNGHALVAHAAMLMATD